VPNVVRSVERAGRHLLVDGRALYIRSGEVQYWRVPRSSWSAILDRAVDGGLNCISSGVPWYWHEPDPGTFDFTGVTDPQRDVKHFIELVIERGLKYFPRPGPWYDGDISYGAHPAWLIDGHPEVLSHDARGDVSFWLGSGQPVPSQLGSDYLKYADRWYANVIPFLARYDVSRGGPIVLIQPDNQLNLIGTFGISGSLYDDHIIGGPGQPGMWHEWLTEFVGPLHDIERRYGESFAELAAVQPPRGRVSGEYGRRRVLDWLRFKEWHAFTYGAYLGGRMREHGITVPYTLNEPIGFLWQTNPSRPGGPGDHPACAKYMEAHRQNAFTTGHIYLYGGEQDALGVPVTLDRIEMIKSSSLDGPAFCVEFGGGWGDYSRRRAVANWGVLLKLALGHGIDGFTYFMYASALNPRGVSVLGRDYGWEAPLTIDGEPRTAYRYTTRLARFVRSWEREILGTRKAFDATIAIFSELPFIAKFCEEPERLEFASDTHYTGALGPYGQVFSGFTPLMTVLTDMNVNVEYVSLNHPNRLPGDECGILLVPNPGEIPAEGFPFLVRHIEAGGDVLFFPTVPTRDCDGYPHPELAELLGFEQPERLPVAGIKPGDIRWRTVDGVDVDDVAVDYSLHLHVPPAGAQTLITHRGRPCAYRQQIGRSRVTVSGIIPTYLTADSQLLYRELFLGALRGSRAAFAENERLHVVLRESRDDPLSPALVTVVNALGEEGQTRLVVRKGGSERAFPKLSLLEVRPRSACLLWLDLRLGRYVVSYCTSELTRLSADSFELYGDIGTEGEIAFTEPVRASVDGSELNLINLDGLWIGTYLHGRDPSVLALAD
jgi:beta-galactosidase